jgi:hypothetical protein
MTDDAKPLATIDVVEGVLEDASEAALNLIKSLTLEADGSLSIFGAPATSVPTGDRLDVREMIVQVVDRLNATKKALDLSIKTTMLADRSTTLYHPRYTIALAPDAPKPEVNAEMLYKSLHRLAGEGKCDIKQVQKAVKMDVDPVYSYTMTSLKPLLKLGGEVLKSYEAASYVEPEPEGGWPLALTIKPK